MVERIDIERALDDLISNEDGMRFQGLAVALAKLRWPDLIACERHKDMGLDAYANPILAPDKIGKGLACSTTATFAKVNGDAKAAKEHYGPASVLIFATPRKVTKPTEKKWSDKIRTEYGYELVVISREEIISLLQFPDNAWICRTHLKIPVPYQPAIADLLQQIREAATAMAAEWASHPRLAGKPQIALNVVLLDGRGGDTREVWTTDHLRTLLLQGRRIVLEAPAGRGKTTTLIQLAQAKGDAQGIPILVDLPGWTKSGMEILEYIARSPAFRARGLDADALARLAVKEPLQFLLNGWNEVSELHSQDAADALRTLERAFPAAGIIVATRTHHIIPPLPGSARFRLLPLTPDQRLDYLVQALGVDAARRLLSQLSRDRVLDDLTRTPFILSEVTAIFRSGNEVPRTKLRLLGAVVELIERADEHSVHLQAHPLRGRAADYLRALAAQLTARGDVLLADAEARAICLSTGDRLREAGQVALTPEPSEILNALCSHHILERSEYPEISFRFEHQQFQEYYSALTLRDLLREVSAAADQAQRDEYARSYVNEPAWEEPLRMVAQDMGEALGDKAAGAILVQTALKVDPVFAATLFRLVGPTVQTEVRSDVSNRLRSLYATPNQHYRLCALAAILATGSDEFADILLPLLTNPDQQVRLTTYRAGAQLHLSSLGPEWRRIVATWSEEHRREFVSELTMLQGRSEVALTFARSDASLIVRLAALRALSWIGQHDEVAGILQSLPDPEFEQAIQELDVEDLPSSVRARALLSYTAVLGEAAEAKARLQIALRLAELGDSEAAARLKHELSNLPAALIRDLNDYYLRPAAEIVRRADPEWLSQWVTDRVVEGALRGDNWLSMISGVSKDVTRRLLQRSCTEDLRRSGASGAVAVLEAAADPDLARAVFLALRDHRRELLADPQNEEKQAIDAQLRHLLWALPPALVIEGLSDILTQPPRDEELAIVTEMFSRKGDQDNDLKATLPDDLRQRLRAYLKSAVPMVLARDDFRGELKGHLAPVLAEVGESKDIDDLMAMIRADIVRVREGRLAMARREQTARAQGSSACWSGWHVQALLRLDHVQRETILLDLLNEPEYELDAAWALQVTARTAAPSNNAIMAARFGQPARDYQKIRTAPESHPTFHEDLRLKYAAAIKRRILNLLEESKTGDHKIIAYHHRLKELAKVLAAIDSRHSTDLILDIAGLAARSDGWLRAALLEELVFAGVVLPADRVLAIIEPVLDEFRRHGIYSNAGLLNHILCLLPFVDPPEQGVARLRALMSEFHLHWHDQANLLMALGQSKDDAGLAWLRELARPNDPGFQHVARDWLEAIAASPHPGATPVLMGFIDSGSEDAVVPDLPEHAMNFLAGTLSERARTDASLAARIIQLSSQPVSGQRRLILAQLVGWLGCPEALLAGLNLIDDASTDPVPYELWKAIEDVFLEKRSGKASPQSYTLVPRAASDIKERLFEMAKHDPKRAKTAYNLLGQIEEWRLEYGRPASEPRHPLYESGESWPPTEPPRLGGPVGEDDVA
ncbi:MAG: hypothetical protein LAP61_27365 [Acidobacteriia bacterium]|nr:hypothetical protein [Terriglobia bacterium]